MKKRMWYKRLKELVQGEYGRFWLGLSPLIFVFLLTEWLLVKGLESFSQVVGFVGLVAVPVVAGAFPILLFVASRRKGEHVPGFAIRFLDHPVVAGVIYCISVGILFLHGLLIWQDPFQRVLALLMGVAVLVTTYLMIRQGAFARRLVIEIQQDASEGTGTFNITDSGKVPAQTSVRLGYSGGEQVFQAANGAIAAFSTLSSATFHLRDISAQELLVWLHRVTPEGYSQNLPAVVNVSQGKVKREFQVDGAVKPFVIPLREFVQQEQNDRSDVERQLAIEVQLASETT